MEKKDSSKQILLSMVAVAILVVAVVGVSFAFFSYTLNGAKENELRVGSINFVANETNMQLDNAFPIAASDATAEPLADENKTDVLVSTVTINGKTTYRYGIDFTITAEEITNTLKVPVDLVINATNTDKIAFNDDFATLLDSSTGKQVMCSGHINPVSVEDYEDTTLDSKITIKAFINKAKVLITDTDTTTEEGREEYSTKDWNDKALSFRIKVVAVEGTKATHEAANPSTGA